MKHSFIMVMDFYFSEVTGGAEANAECLLDRFIESGIPMVKMKSHEVTVEFLKNNKHKVFIFSNFILLKQECRQYAINNLKYFVYEQDHKYIKSRNPIKYVNFVAPKEERVNIDFYKGAIRVLFLTKLSMEVFHKNTDLTNLLNLQSSVWRKEELAYLRTICNNEKDKRVAVMDSDNPIKRRNDCINLCRKNNWEYNLVKDSNFKKFLEKMSKHNKLLFLTGHLETCARIVVEAKMLNMKVITNKKLIGATSEEWYKLSGKQLIDKMEEISSYMPTVILEAVGD